MKHPSSRVTRPSFLAGLGLFLLAAVAAPTANAAPIVAGQTILPSIAIQDITLLPNTPFNPTSSPILFKDFSGTGYLRINRNAEVGNTIAIPTLDGLYYGFNPVLGSYVFGSVPPLTATNFSGRIDNVVQNPSDPGFATGQPSTSSPGNSRSAATVSGWSSCPDPRQGSRCSRTRPSRSRSGPSMACPRQPGRC